MNYNKRMDNALTLFWCKTSDRKRDTPDRKLLLRACLHGGGGPQVGEVTCLGEVKK